MTGILNKKRTQHSDKKKTKATRGGGRFVANLRNLADTGTGTGRVSRLKKYVAATIVDAFANIPLEQADLKTIATWNRDYPSYPKYIYINNQCNEKNIIEFPPQTIYYNEIVSSIKQRIEESAFETVDSIFSIKFTHMGDYNEYIVFGYIKFDSNKAFFTLYNLDKSTHIPHFKKLSQHPLPSKVTFSTLEFIPQIVPLEQSDLIVLDKWNNAPDGGFKHVLDTSQYNRIPKKIDYSEDVPPHDYYYKIICALKNGSLEKKYDDQYQSSVYSFYNMDTVKIHNLPYELVHVYIKFNEDKTICSFYEIFKENGEYKLIDPKTTYNIGEYGINKKIMIHQLVIHDNILTLEQYNKKIKQLKEEARRRSEEEKRAQEEKEDREREKRRAWRETDEYKEQSAMEIRNAQRRADGDLRGYNGAQVTVYGNVGKHRVGVTTNSDGTHVRRNIRTGAIVGGKPKNSIKKVILGKERCIYKIPGSRKEHIKHKGELVTVADYKKLMKSKTQN